MLSKSEIMNDLEKLAARFDEGSEAVGRELAAVVESITAAWHEWESSLNEINERRDRLDTEEAAFRDSINVRRDDLDAEELTLNQNHSKAMREVNARLTALSARMGAAPPQLVASNPKPIATPMGDSLREMLSNKKKQASSGVE